MKETLLNKSEVECLLTRAGGNIEEAIKTFPWIAIRQII